MRTRLSVLMFLVYAAPGAWWPVFSLHLTQLSFSPELIGLCGATGAMAQLLAPLIAGQVADRWLPAQYCCAASACASGTLLWLLAGLTDPAAVFWVSLATWLVMVPTMTLAIAICFTHLSDPARSYGGVRMWGTLGWVAAGLLLGGWLRWAGADADRTDGFRLGALFAFALAGYAVTLPHTPPARRREGAPWFAPLGALHLLRGRPFAVYTLAAFGLCVTLPFAMQVTPLLLRQLGVAEAEVPQVMTLAQSTEVVSLALLPVILLRLGVRGTMLVGAASWAGALAVQAAGEPDWLIILSLAPHGLCICCFLVAGQVYVNGRSSPDVRASSQALLSFINGLGLLLGNLLAGVVRGQSDGAFSPALGTAAAVAFAALLIFVIGFPSEETAAAAGDESADEVCEPASRPVMAPCERA